MRPFRRSNFMGCCVFSLCRLTSYNEIDFIFYFHNSNKYSWEPKLFPYFYFPPLLLIFLALSLLNLLHQESTLQEDQEEEGGISEEDIKFFLANQSVLQRQRLELREDLRRRFNAMQQQRGASPISSPASSPSPSPKSHSKVCHS